MILPYLIARCYYHANALHHQQQQQDQHQDNEDRVIAQVVAQNEKKPNVHENAARVEKGALHNDDDDRNDKISKIRWRYKDIFRMFARSIREISRRSEYNGNLANQVFYAHMTRGACKESN
jgi:uncharacterized protein (DUF2267 family)